MLPDPTRPKPAVWPDNPDAWQQMARALAEDARRASPRAVFLGDSITQAWGSDGKAEWDARFAPLGAANLGIGGDRTQNVLWRIENGALDGLHLHRHHARRLPPVAARLRPLRRRPGASGPGHAEHALETV